MKVGRMFDIISRSVGDNIELETYDGLVRQGKMTGLTTRQIVFNDEKVEIPTELELNGDPLDRIPLTVIKKLDLY
jgi:hypothetical protein